jgi:hypothetical protein
VIDAVGRRALIADGEGLRFLQREGVVAGGDTRVAEARAESDPADGRFGCDRGFGFERARFLELRAGAAAGRVADGASVGAGGGAGRRVDDVEDVVLGAERSGVRRQALTDAQRIDGTRRGLPSVADPVLPVDRAGGADGERPRRPAVGRALHGVAHRRARRGASTCPERRGVVVRCLVERLRGATEGEDEDRTDETDRTHESLPFK